MHSNLYAVTPPTEESVDIIEAKLACRVDSSDEDSFIEGLIRSARQWAESLTGRVFITQTWELKLPCFPGCEIELPKPPLVAPVTSVKYLDPAGVLQTWATSEYIVTAPTGEFAGRARIEPAYGISYPATLPVPDAVRIVFVAGYGARAAVPQGIRNGHLYHVAESYMNRERPDYSAAEAAIWPWCEVRFD